MSWVSVSMVRATVCIALSRNESRGGEFGIFLGGGEVGGVVIDDASDGLGLWLGEEYGFTLNCSIG